LSTATKKARFLSRFLIWAGLFALTVAIWARPSRSSDRIARIADPLVIRNRVYRTHGANSLRLDIYVPRPIFRPAGKQPRLPAVLAIHGGSWVGGSKSGYGPQLARLVKAGYVVFVADYRLARPGAPSWPEALDDLRAAVRWIRVHADEFHVDPGRIVALGSSAGGSLALLLGSLPATSDPGEVSSRVQAVVSFYAPSDLVALVASRKLGHEPALLFTGIDDEHLQAIPYHVSPINHVGRGHPPTLLIHGTEDRWVPLEQSLRLDQALGEAGVSHRMLVVPGARHGFELTVKFPQTRNLLPEILAFLENVWQVD
jgi:acetyl esterase/lipase